MAEVNEQVKYLSVECPECEEMQQVSMERVNMEMECYDKDIEGCSSCCGISGSVDISFYMKFSCPGCGTMVRLDYDESGISI